jgi:hypothetical protein
METHIRKVLRFGIPKLCRRLDHAMGDCTEPATPLRPAGLIETRRSFAEPLSPPRRRPALSGGRNTFIFRKRWSVSDGVL